MYKMYGGDEKKIKQILSASVKTENKPSFVDYIQTILKYTVSNKHVSKLVVQHAGNCLIHYIDC